MNLKWLLGLAILCVLCMSLISADTDEEKAARKKARSLARKKAREERRRQRQNGEGGRKRKRNKKTQIELSLEDDLARNVSLWNASGFYSETPQNPGFRARITQKGFDYAAQFATDFLALQMNKFEIPDVQKEVGTVVVRISSVTVQEFPSPTNHISIIPNKGLRWEVWDMQPVFTADYFADMGFGLFTISKEGNVTVHAEDLRFQLDFIIEQDPTNGRPFILSTNCNASGEVTIDFNGGWSDMLNVGSTVFRSYIRDTITEQICMQAKSEIDINMQSELDTLKMSEKVAELFELDFAFTEFPTFRKKYLETKHKGTVYFSGDHHEPPFTAAPMPEFKKHTQKMMYLYVTDYVINSGLYAAFLAGHMNFNVTQDVMDMVPDDAKTILRLTCRGSSVCLGSAFPQLVEMFGPQLLAEVDLYATQSPVVYFHGNNKAHLSSFNEAQFYVIYRGEREHLFTAEINITASVKVEVNGSHVRFDIRDITPTAVVKESSIGEAETGMAFDELLKQGAEKVIMQKIQAIAKEGFEIPSTEDVKFHNSEVIPVKQKGLFVVASDIYINPDLDVQKLIEEQKALAEAKKQEEEKNEG